MLLLNANEICSLSLSPSLPAAAKKKQYKYQRAISISIQVVDRESSVFRENKNRDKMSAMLNVRSINRAVVCFNCIFNLLFSFLQCKETVTFEGVWPKMRPIVLRVLKQEPVSQSMWQDLFYGVHSICLWDEKGAIKIYDSLQEDIVAFINVN